jgi:peroxiredoxin
MNAMVRLGAVIALAGCLFPGSRALAVDPGGLAPPFDLRLMDGSGSVCSDELFPAHDYTFVVFWRSSCPHCVDALLACERFYRRYGGEDITVLGINADEGSLLSARGAIEASGITFPQAHDDGGAVSASYGVVDEIFTVFLVGGDGAVVDVRVDPQGDVGAAMEEMLTSPRGPSAPGEPVAPEAAGSGGGPGISFRGLQRIRYLGVDSRGDGAAGLYGEPVSSGSGVQYRLEVEASKRLTENLRAGGLLRISNEGRKVLESGPEYLGSEWGSAFAEIGAGDFRFRLGYYDLFMTPLTLMRWDWDDNPRVGGDTGCGCGGAAAGALLVESLEELGPDLVFEGALATYGHASVEARLFYAIPRRSVETSYNAYRYSGTERARYSQEMAGFEGRWQRLDGRTGSFWKAGVHAITTFENKRSVDFAGLGDSSTDPWVSTWTVSVTGEAPLLRHVRLRGEFVGWNRTDERGVLTEDGLMDAAHEGGGGVGGIAIEKSQGLGALIDYVRLAPDFYAPMAALSYESNTEGLRASARMPLGGDIASLSLFHKRLREIDAPLSGMERKQISISGASLDVDCGGILGVGLGWLEKRSQREGSIAPSDSYRRGIAASVHRDLGKAGVVRLQYERISVESSGSDIETKSGADMYSLYSSLKF